MDAFSVARYGMMAASRRFEAAATKVVNPMSGGLDTEAMVEMTLAKTQFKAQVGVIRIADEMQRALLNLQSASD
jgi:flagellar basal body rod protein FlgC